MEKALLYQKNFFQPLLPSLTETGRVLQDRPSDAEANSGSSISVNPTTASRDQ